MTVLILFLTDLFSKFNNAHQVLKLQVKNFNQTVKSLVTAEASMKESDQSFCQQSTSKALYSCIFV